MFCLPRKHVKSVTGTITHVSQQFQMWKFSGQWITKKKILTFQYDTNFNRFWLRSADEERLFNEIQSELNKLSRDIEEFQDPGDIHVGQVVAASWSGEYYRAKVQFIVRKDRTAYYNVLLFNSFPICSSISIIYWTVSGAVNGHWSRRWCGIQRIASLVWLFCTVHWHSTSSFWMSIGIPSTIGIVFGTKRMEMRNARV